MLQYFAATDAWQISGMDLRYVPVIVGVYYGIGLVMVLLTSRQRAIIRKQKQDSSEKSHSSFGSDQADPSVVQVMRLVSSLRSAGVSTRLLKLMALEFCYCAVQPNGSEHNYVGIPTICDG